MSNGTESKVERNKVFISYSHKDKKWLGRVQNHIKDLENLGMSVELWDDTKIKPSMKWQDEIKKALATTKVAILLVSTDFLASEFIMSNELPPLLKAAEDDGAAILSVILEPCLYEKTELAQFQSTNAPGKPLSKMRKNGQDEVFVKLTNRISELL